MRLPSQAGGFYPKTKEELEAELNLLFSREVKSFDNALGIIVPHAGYMFSGEVAAAVYKSISRTKKKKFIILGVDHFATGVIATSKQDWQTPLGIAEIDREFIDKITEEQAVIPDEIVMRREHSIEVQLPFLQYVFREFKFVPIQLPRISHQEIKELTEVLASKDHFFIASSDLTHYGRSYGFLPKESFYDPLDFVKKIDEGFIDVIKRLDGKKLVDYAVQKDLTVCGTIPIALLLEITAKLGATKVEKLVYDTSFSFSRDASQIVGYGGLVIY